MKFTKSLSGTLATILVFVNVRGSDRVSLKRRRRCRQQVRNIRPLLGYRHNPQALDCPSRASRQWPSGF
jgi:hypothetical protein